jgi:hypothetical protein
MLSHKMILRTINLLHFILLMIFKRWIILILTIVILKLLK